MQVNKGQACYPTVSLSLCVCLDILRSSPRIVPLIELYRWRHIPPRPEWTDSLWMSLLTYFDPKFRDSPTGLSATIFLWRTKVVSSEGAVLFQSAATDRRITNQNTRYAALKTRSSRKQNRCLCPRHCQCDQVQPQREVLGRNSSILDNRTHSVHRRVAI